MWTSILSFIAQPFLYLLKWYAEKLAHDEKARREYLAFLEIMQRKGIVSVEYRLKATEQIDRIKAEWEKENGTNIN
jgi:hypothetical protein